MLSSALSKTLIQTALFSTVSFLAIGLQPASAIVLTVGNSTLTDTDFGCNNLTSNILDCYGFNNFDDSSQWLTATDGGKWAIKATLIAASGTLSTSTTGEGTAAKVLTLTNATFQYMGGATTGSTSTFTGLSLSHNFDFTTTTRTGSTLFANPTMSHRLSGKLQSSDGLDARNRAVSNVSFSGSGRVGTSTTDTTATFTDRLTTDSITAAGNPFGTTFSFLSAADDSVASLAGFGSSAFYLRSGTVTAKLQGVTLAQGDTLYLPASECTVIYETNGNRGQPRNDNESKGNNGLGNGVDPQPPGNPKPNDTEQRVAEHEATRNNQNSNRNQSSNGNNGSNGNQSPNPDSDEVEKLCNKIARSVTSDPAAVPEPNGAMPVLGGMLLAGAVNIIRKFKI